VDYAASVALFVDPVVEGLRALELMPTKPLRWMRRSPPASASGVFSSSVEKFPDISAVPCTDVSHGLPGNLVAFCSGILDGVFVTVPVIRDSRVSNQILALCPAWESHSKVEGRGW